MKSKEEIRAEKDTIRCPVCGYDFGISVEDSYADPAECPSCIEAELVAEAEREREIEERAEQDLLCITS